MSVVMETHHIGQINSVSTIFGQVTSDILLQPSSKHQRYILIEEVFLFKMMCF